MEFKATEADLALVDIEKNELKVGENKPLLWGIGMVAVGGLISLATYTSANPGESYVVMTGLLLVGGINLIRGVYLQVKHGSKARTRA